MLPGAMGEVGNFGALVSDKGLLTCVLIGISVVAWDVSVFAKGWDRILSFFFLTPVHGALWLRCVYWR